jgi:lipopolysaccharide transport system permease protein
MDLKEDKDFVVYSPESQLRSPMKLMRSMWCDMKASRELAWRLTIRDISARYRQSLFGVLWAFLPPIATALIFVVLNREGALNIGDTEIPYPAFVMVGTVLWQLFIDSLNAPLRMVIASKPMLAKINFPREALILSAVAQVLFDFGIRLVILVGVFIIFKIQLMPGMVFAVFAIIMLMLLGIMIGMLLTPIGVLYSDVLSALTTVTTLWFFVTPVVYPAPESWPYSLLGIVNPVSPLLVGARDLLTLGTISNIVPFIAVSVITLIGLIVMWVLYRVALPILTERMPS